MQSNDQRPSVENLNEALRLYRRMALRVAVIFIGGVIIDILLVKLGTLLSPPYGIYVMGEGLGEWGMIAILVLVVAEIWIDGQAVGKALNDPALQRLPVLGIMSGLPAIAQHAHAYGMEWSGFLGPLRPAKQAR